MDDLLVMAKIAGRRCALNAHDVKSVIDIGTVTPVPRAPEYITGITAMRSQALTVIDCRQALGFSLDDWPRDHRAIVVSVSGHSYALRIDAIEDVSTALGEAEEVPGGFGPEWSQIALGMVETRGGPALLIDLSAMITGRASAVTTV